VDRLLAGGGARKEVGLGRPKDGVIHGMYVLPILFLPYWSHP
jgi:hypothetical protein